MKSPFLLAVVLTFLWPSASLHGQIAQRPAVRASGPVADTLRDLAVHMMSMLRDRDTEGLIGLYGDTLHFVHVEDGNVVPWSELSAMMRRYLASATSNPISIQGDPGVTAIDRDNAVLYVTHRFDGGPDDDAYEGVWTGVMHRFAEGWRIVHSHSSDRAPG